MFITPWDDKEFGLQIEELEAEYTEDEEECDFENESDHSSEVEIVEN